MKLEHSSSVFKKRLWCDLGFMFASSSGSKNPTQIESAGKGVRKGYALDALPILKVLRKHPGRTVQRGSGTINRKHFLCWDKQCFAIRPGIES